MPPSHQIHSTGTDYAHARVAALANSLLHAAGDHFTIVRSADGTTLQLCCMHLQDDALRIHIVAGASQCTPTRLHLSVPDALPTPDQPVAPSHPSLPYSVRWWSTMQRATCNTDVRGATGRRSIRHAARRLLAAAVARAGRLDAPHATPTRCVCRDGQSLWQRLTS